MSHESMLHARIRWAAASMARFVDLATREGWGTGSATFHEPLAGDAVGAEVSPFDLLEARLGLSTAQVDALWLLACAEIEPALARFLSAVAIPGMPDVSVSV